MIRAATREPRAQAKKMSSLKLLLVLSLFPTQGVSARVLLRGGPAREEESAKSPHGSALRAQPVAQARLSDEFARLSDEFSRIGGQRLLGEDEDEDQDQDDCPAICDNCEGCWDIHKCECLDVERIGDADQCANVVKCAEITI